MKVFYVSKNIIFHHHPEYMSAAEASQYFHPDFVFVDAPDYVFEGWGYDPTAEGDARFIKPTPPEGWLYDDGTGTFYPEGEIAPSENPTYDELLSMARAIERGMIR